MPALILNYFGQGALVLENAEAVKNPFFMMAPEWALWPLVLLATAATVIASQAVITGAFALTQQVMQLGSPAALGRASTPARRRPGRCNVPSINWRLMVFVLGLVV